MQRRLEERYPLRSNAGPQVEKMVIERVGPLLEALAEAGVVDVEELDVPDDLDAGAP